MIESVSTVGNIQPFSSPVIQKPSPPEALPDQERKGADVRHDTDPSLLESPKPEQNVERISEIVGAVQESLDMIKEQTTHLRFSVHEQTDQVMVKVTNPDSGEVIREIPSQEFLDLAAKFEKMVGLMFDMKI